MPFVAALLSLFHTINHLRDSSQISLDPHSTEIINCIGEELNGCFLIISDKLEGQTVTNIFINYSKRLNLLDGEIGDAVYKLEDIIESHVLDQLLLSQSSFGNETTHQDDHPSSLYSINLLEIKQDIQSLAKTVKKMLQEYLEELDGKEEKVVGDDNIAAPSSRIIASVVEESKMVGLSDKLEELKYKLTHFKGDSLVVSGMAGIGKTALAKKFFEDESIVNHFDRLAWVTVGRKCQLEEIVRGILTQVAPNDGDRMELLTEKFERKIRDFKSSLTNILQRILPQMNPDGYTRLREGHDEIAAHSESSLKKALKGILAYVSKVPVKGYQKIAAHLKASLNRILIAQDLKRILGHWRYLIVLDDVWDAGFLETMGRLLPKHNNGSKVLCTSRLRYCQGSHVILNMRLMNKDESWDLFCEKMFGKDQLCPLQLEVVGKKIVERCEGLPLTIVTVANLLSKTKKIPKYWTEVATQKKHKVFIDAYDEISKVLYRSYEFLPPLIKAHFLYLGVFPLSYEISSSKLINLGKADGSLIDDVDSCLFLFYFNLVMPCLESTCKFDIVSIYQVKTWRLHSSMWHLCTREARNTKFFHILDDPIDGSEESIKSQRRLCIHNNFLFGIKDVYNSMENNCASTARCLLCLGPYHQYPVPICFSLRLLRVLHASTIRLYEFPIQVLNLILLRYLALTFDGNLPTSIAKLCYLQFLIVGRHLSIKPYGGPSYLPMEIWHMKDLLHLQVMGNDLPDPCGASLPNLVTLLDVSPHSCSKNVLEAIPNLKNLGIRIELMPDVVESLSCVDHISCLHELESLKCVIVNPEYRSEIVAPLASLSNFPARLRKLTLSGLGHPWREMSKISSLPNLEVLKLRCYAFQGPKWEVKKKGFQKLKFLLIQDTDLVQWKVGCKSFRKLQCLRIKHCYKLEDMPWKSKVFPELVDLEIVDCNPILMFAAKEKESALEKYAAAHFHVHSSWIDGN